MADDRGPIHRPDRMYELEVPAPQLASTDGRGPVLIHALEGFSDAGHAVRLGPRRRCTGAAMSCVLRVCGPVLRVPG